MHIDAPSGLSMRRKCSIAAGFNVKTVSHKKVDFTVWDVGGRDKACQTDANDAPLTENLMISV